MEELNENIVGISFPKISQKFVVNRLILGLFNDAFETT